ncbi:MAG: hypothetical protein QW165_04265 [Candidatus Woesearchaeota archaeon]
MPDSYLEKILKDVRIKPGFREEVYKKAVGENYYQNDTAGKVRFFEDIKETPQETRCAPGQNGYGTDPAYSNLAADEKKNLIAGIASTLQEQYEKKAVENAESNKASGKAFKIAGVAGILAGFLTFGSCLMDNDAPRYHQGYPARRIEQPVNAKNAYAGAGALLASVGALAFMYGMLKRKN